MIKGLFLLLVGSSLSGEELTPFLRGAISFIDAYSILTK